MIRPFSRYGFTETWLESFYALPDEKKEEVIKVIEYGQNRKLWIGQRKIRNSITINNLTAERLNYPKKYTDKVIDGRQYPHELGSMYKTVKDKGHTKEMF